MDTLKEALVWLDGQGNSGVNDAVAFFDATNTTPERRRLIQRVLEQHESGRGCSGVKLIFLESICNDQAVIQRNLLQKVSK